MPRVLHLIDTGGPGGGETVFASLVAALPQLDWRCRTLVPREGWLSDRLRGLGADVRRCASRGSADLRYLGALAAQLRDFRPDVIHAHFLTSGVYGTLASNLVGGCPLVCTFHGLPDVRSTDRLLFLKARILSRRANRIVYVSNDLRRHLEPVLGAHRHLSEVIHNGITFFTPANRGQARCTLEVRGDEVVVGAVGNVRKAKDYPNLLRAARLICDRRQDVVFRVVGEWDETLGSGLHGLVQELKLGSRFRFLGFREDATALMSGFDVFVSSSSSEGLPLASLEAMGMGKPVVLTACGGVPEMVDHGEDGILVPPRNPQALAAAVLGLLAAPVEAARLGEAAQTSVRRRFSLDRMVNRYDFLYRDLVKRYPASYA